MICYYHSKDLDGYCSGAIVKKRYPDCVMVGYDYGEDFPWPEADQGNTIIMIDVSLPMPDMYKLSELCGGNFTWIDHHASAIKAYNEYDNNTLYPINTVLKDGIAACEIGWDYFYPNDDMPLAIELLGKYDTWRNQQKYEWDGYIIPFQYGMRLFCNSLETFPTQVFSFKEDLHKEWVRSVIKSGETVLEYQRMQNERACKGAFEVEFEGLRAICLNNGGANSQVFESVYDEFKHDIMIPFVYTGNLWKFSIYTTRDDINCVELAKKHGGGGHRKAAGFQKEVLPSLFQPQISAIK